MNHDEHPINLPMTQEEAACLHDQLSQLLACFRHDELPELRRVLDRLGVALRQ